MEGAKNIVFLVSTLLIFAGGLTSDITCGDNEVVDDCPRNCSSEYCPTSEVRDTSPCPRPDTCPPPKCACRFNYRRAANNTCIATTSCPSFKCSKQNEEYNSCPALCPTDSCADAPLHGRCPFLILIVLNCNPTCQCKEGFCRENGTCIPYVENVSDKEVRKNARFAYYGMDILVKNYKK